MAEKYGIDNIKKLTLAVCDTTAVLADVIANGTSYFKDIADLPKLISATQEFTAVDYTAVSPECLDLSATEQDDLVVFFGQHLKLGSANAEAVVKEGLAVVSEGVDLVRNIKTYYDQYVSPKTAN